MLQNLYLRIKATRRGLMTVVTETDKTCGTMKLRAESLVELE